MSCSYEDIKRYFHSDRGKNSTHMLVVRDNFDYDCYPVYTSDPRREVDAHHGKNMQSVMEVYDLRRAFFEQHVPWPGRVWNVPEKDS